MKQAPGAWHEILHDYLVKFSFERKFNNNNLYLKNGKNNKLLLSKIFFDDIIVKNWLMKICNYCHLWKHMIHILT